MKAPTNNSVLLTRPLEDSKSHIEALEKDGFKAICIPVFEIQPIQVDTALLQQSLEKANWVVFTSVNAIKYFPCEDIPSDTKIACVGDKTKDFAIKQGLKVDFIPDTFTAKTLANTLPANPEDTIVYPCAKRASDTIEAILCKRTREVIRYNVYDNQTCKWTQQEIDLARAVDWVMIMSGSAAKGILENLGSISPSTRVISIGPSTTKACQKLGLKVDFTASPHNWKGIQGTLMKNR